jgi:uncharacterized membrane-anchored protein YhcB (DUF1043 family)
LTTLDTDTLGLIVQIIIPVGTVAVLVTIFLMKLRHRQEMNHLKLQLEQQKQQQPTQRDLLNDMAREINDYIKCIETMKSSYTDKFMSDDTTKEDKEFYKRLISELDENLRRQRNQLTDFIDRISKSGVSGSSKG